MSETRKTDYIRVDGPAAVSREGDYFLDVDSARKAIAKADTPGTYTIVRVTVIDEDLETVTRQLPEAPFR
jgi:hypothetical protein